jgi:uncharacterized protein (TIGR02266 family)
MEGKIFYNLAEEETYQDGDIIFKEGSRGDWVYVVLSGSVEISKTVEGKKYMIAVLQPGELLGELGFVGGIKRTATARSIGETTLGVIDRDFLEREYNQLSSQFRSILDLITVRFKKMLDRSCEFTTRGEARVQKTISLEYKDAKAFVEAFTANASSRGLFVKTDDPLPQGEAFLLKLKLPGLADPLQIKCEVVWNRPEAGDLPDRPAGMGIKFREISKQDHERLKTFLKSASGEK